MMEKQNSLSDPGSWMTKPKPCPDTSSFNNYVPIFRLEGLKHKFLSYGATHSQGCHLEAEVGHFPWLLPATFKRKVEEK